MTRAAHPPVRLTPGLVAVVALGGALGTGLRYALSSALPEAGGWPWATFSVNLLGAFALGLLLEALVRRGPEDTSRRRWRLGLGTGLLGGLTTVSSLALEVEHMLASGDHLLGVSYATASVVAGVALAFAGIALAARRSR